MSVTVHFMWSCYQSSMLDDISHMVPTVRVSHAFYKTSGEGTGDAAVVKFNGPHTSGQRLSWHISKQKWLYQGLTMKSQVSRILSGLRPSCVNEDHNT